MNRWLLASDLHLTDAPRDVYRFGLFDWMASVCEESKVSHVMILGDVTDRKDNHSGVFLNKISESFLQLTSHEYPKSVHIIQGNHDYTDPENATLRIMNNPSQNIFWYEKPTVVQFGSSQGQVLFVPFERNTENFIRNLGKYSSESFSAIFFHQTFTGALTSTGIKMEGISLSAVDSQKCRLFSGDIHVPQEIGRICYVGSPYPIRFGDDFTGRCILYNPETNDIEDVHFPTISKRTLNIKSPDELHNSAIKGDQIKVRISISKDEMFSWAKIRKQIVEISEKCGFDLCGVEVTQTKESASNGEISGTETDFMRVNPNEVFDLFCNSEGIENDSDLKIVGKNILENL